MEIYLTELALINTPLQLNPLASCISTSVDELDERRRDDRSNCKFNDSFDASELSSALRCGSGVRLFGIGSGELPSQNCVEWDCKVKNA